VRSAQIRKQLNWEELTSKRQMHLSLLMYDAVNRNVPSYLSDLSRMHVRTTLTSLSYEKRNIMLYWTMLQKQNIIKNLSRIEEEYCGIHYQLT